MQCQWGQEHGEVWDTFISSEREELFSMEINKILPLAAMGNNLKLYIIANEIAHPKKAALEAD